MILSGGLHAQARATALWFLVEFSIKFTEKGAAASAETRSAGASRSPGVFRRYLFGTLSRLLSVPKLLGTKFGLAESSRHSPSTTNLY